MDFFFTSRRRHTRCSRDWSSDVCSSDLQPVAARVAREHAAGAVGAVRRGCQPDHEQARPRVAKPGDGFAPVRPVAEFALLVLGDATAITAQPRAALAGYDRPIDDGEASEF